jgi:hypothetical protein
MLWLLFEIYGENSKTDKSARNLADGENDRSIGGSNSRIHERPLCGLASGEVHQRLSEEEIHNFRSVPYLRGLSKRRFRHG